MTVPQRLCVACPAKVNVWLRVLGRRADGYHEVRTRLQAIDLWDRLEAVPARALILECTGPVPVVVASNLVLRAAEVVRRRAGATRGASFRLVKTIPVAAGLGGGSSDAAGAIVLLDRMWRLRMSERDRHTAAAEVGSDVPFFLVGGTADASGRGEIVTAVPFEGQVPVLLGLPPFGVSTADVYRDRAVRLTPPGKDVSVPRLSGSGEAVGSDSSARGNDLENVVFANWPELLRFRDDLRSLGATTALLSGSGSTVFGEFESADRRDEAREALRARYRRWRLVGTTTIPDGIRWDVDS